MWLFTLTFLLGFSSLLGSNAGSEQTPCDARKMDATQSSFVCVCNATYSDDLPPPALPEQGTFAWIVSDISSLRFRQTVGQLVHHAGQTDFVVTNNSGQEVFGFGGAVTDSAAYNILKLSTPTQDQLLRSYFSENGLGYTFVRTNIGGCDFSSRGYTYADTDGDVGLKTFALQPEDLEMKIPIITRAKAMSPEPLKVFAAAWSAPKWMKENHSLVGKGRLLEKYYQAWAEYHVRFLEAYRDRNITLWGLSSQNEPTDGEVPGFTFNCMGWTAELQQKFIAEFIGPLLHERGFGDLHLMTMDDQRFHLPKWPKTVFEDLAANNFSDGVAVHWYWDQYMPASALDETHAAFPDKFILNTEACTGEHDGVRLGNWERLEQYATDIIQDLEHWVAGWVDWNIALNRNGGPNWKGNFVDSPIIVNEDQDQFYKNPMFYAMGHFSKYIQPGALHLATLNHTTNVTMTAAVNPDGSKVAVLLNKLSADQSISINVGGDRVISQVVPARSINTFLFL